MLDRALVIRSAFVIGAALAGLSAIAAAPAVTNPATSRQAESDSVGQKIMKQVRSGRQVAYRETTSGIEMAPPRASGLLIAENGPVPAIR